MTQQFKYLMRFHVLTAVSMKMAVFWVVAPCSLVEVYRRFRGSCCLHHQGDEIIALMMEAASNNPEDSDIRFKYLPAFKYG
jgi:hypothetical protein